MARTGREGSKDRVEQTGQASAQRSVADLAASIEACLLGGAIGDALGAEIEFWPLARIRAAFPDGIDRLPPHDGVAGAITDDTQMTLFTAEGLIRAAVRQADKGICHVPGIVHHALLRWLRSQGEAAPALAGGGPDGAEPTGLLADPRLHKRRAPGLTCLSALGAADRLGQPATNDSKGCGTIMRVAPLAFLPRDRIRDLAEDCSALTHGHPTGREAAAAWALILADLLQGDPLEETARRYLGGFGTEVDGAIRAALDAPRDGAPETVESLGGGWTAEEALAIALYACLCARDFEHGLTIAVTHGGDSDSTGAIAGNALGLILPDQVVSHRWAREVECRNLIAALSRDLAEAVAGDSASLVPRYPGG